jgi:hypothetical protein
MSTRSWSGQVHARGDLDDLLVAALDRAVALPQVHEVAVRVAEDLHLDVLGAGDVALDEHLARGRRRRRPRAGFLELAGELLGVLARRACRARRRRSSP